MGNSAGAPLPRDPEGEIHRLKLLLSETIETLIELLDALDGDADGEDDGTGECLEHEDHDEELEGGNDDGDDVSLQLFSGPDPWAQADTERNRNAASS